MPAPAPLPATLVASRLRVERSGHLVLADVSLTVGPDTRMGVVGRNGVGKSTLLEVLAGRLRPDAGTVDLAPPTATVGYLTQERERRPDELVRMYFHRRTGVCEAERTMVEAAEALGSANADVHAGERYAAALERWTNLGGPDLDARIDAALADLGLDASAAGLPAAALSGGQAARVALAAILLSRFDVLLLDEPTNDLDFDGLGRLESFVNARGGGVVVVSHDRAFLARTVTSICEIDEHSRGAAVFAGGWDAFLAERATVRRHAEEAYADYQSKRKDLAARARRERDWATAGTSREKKRPRDNDKAQRDFRINRTERLAARARMTERAVERLDVVEKPWEGWQLRFSIGEAPRAGAVVARLDGAVVRRGDFRLGPIDLEIGWAERLVLAGPNGTGKTTLVDALLGRLPLESGVRWLGPGVVVGELAQARVGLGSGSLLAAFMTRTGLDRSGARTLLAKFGLGAAHVQRAVGSLSPGERTRAELALLQAAGVNFLVLDEPTNHLDVEAIEQLESALANFSGTMLLVSHDRAFLDAVDVTRVIDLAGAPPG